MITIQTMANGLTVIVEEMPHFESLSYLLQIPGGLCVEAEEERGASLVLTDLSERGTARRSSREFSDAFDRIGAHHNTSTGLDRYFIRGTCLKDNLRDVLSLTAEQVQEPSFPADEIAAIRELLLMDLRSLNDNPSQLCMVELTKQYFPNPYNRSNFGSEEGLSAVTEERMRSLWGRFWKPSSAILSIAGNCSATQVLQTVEEFFGGWNGEGEKLPEFTGLPPLRKNHVQLDSAQTQVALAFPSVKFGDPDYYIAKVANEILSGGMFGRLFIEVREKRGLCYSVYSRHNGGRHTGSVIGYAGTTPERAEETLSVMLEVFKGLAGTVTAEELERAKSNLKSALIIGEESPGARAGSNAGDWWLAKRIRTLDEIESAINQVTLEDISRHTVTYQPKDFSCVSVGRKALFN